jgi:predicted Zn-dependent protease
MDAAPIRLDRGNLAMTSRALGLGALVLAAAACARNPVTGKRQLALVSEKQEIELGQESAKQVTEQMGRYPDPKVQAYVESIGKRIAAASERPSLPWSFTVLDDPAVNAFALPGGPVFVTRGILTHMNSEAELASVLGHEIGHITARHSVDQLSKAQLAQVGLGIGSVLSPELAAAGQAAGAGLQLLFLKFGRDAERQADELGFKYMIGQRYDPHEMEKMFVTLERSSAGHGSVPGWLSTHPDPGDRAKKAAERAAAVKDPGATKVDREELLAMVSGMTFGEDPRQGFFQGNAFLHPELKFKLDLPDGWQKANTPGAVMAVSPKKDAAIQLSSAGKLSPEEASKKFFSQQGVKPAALAGSGALPANARYFQADTEQGPVGGLVAFLPAGGGSLMLVGLTGAQSVRAYDGAFKAAVASYGQLTDPAALAVQPAKLELVKVPRDMSVTEFMAEFPSTAPAEVVATINGVAKDGRLQAGRTVKRVVGGVPAPLKK